MLTIFVFALCTKSIDIMLELKVPLHCIDVERFITNKAATSWVKQQLVGCRKLILKWTCMPVVNCHVIGHCC